MVSDNQTLDKVYTAQNSNDLMDAYKDWAAHYESDTVGAFGYVAPVATAKALDRVVDDKAIRILDAGCGTGLVGQALRKLGYEALDALDYSKEMLEEAARKNIYARQMQADLCKPLAIEDDTYDAVVCTGAFTYGHVDPDAFDELIRITKPGGHIVFTVREGAYEDHDYRRRMIELELADAWELLSLYDEEYLKNENVGCKMCTFRVQTGRGETAS
jgi:predicted TPR repeat methyltransferase